MSQQRTIFLFCLIASATFFVRLLWGHTELVSKDEVYSVGIEEEAARILMDTPMPDHHVDDGGDGSGSGSFTNPDISFVSSSSEKGGSLRAPASRSSSSSLANKNERIQSLLDKRRSDRADQLLRTGKISPLKLAQINMKKKNNKKELTTTGNNNHLNNFATNETESTNTTTATTTTKYYRHLPIKKLRVCTPRKVASSATEKILGAWKQLPYVPPPPPPPPLSPPEEVEAEEEFQQQQQLNPKKKGVGSFSFAIIRDPLERLYSGYHNKCLHQRENEPDQCPGFPNARKKPPTFLEFLQESNSNYAVVNNQAGNRRRGPFASNIHFSPMSKECPLSEFDQVFHMSSPTFNHDVAKVWIEQLGAPPDIVTKDFPLTNTTQPQQHSYYSNAAQVASSTYDCQHLLLALPLVVEDYDGQYSDYFPLPTWVKQTLNTTDCQQQIKEWKVKALEMEKLAKIEEEKRIEKLQQLAHEKNVTSLRQVLKHKLQVCTPRKVASSATEKIFWEWKKIPLAPKSLRNPKFLISGGAKSPAGSRDWSYSFAIIRDPLERLYSGYHNKCLHQRENESTQCPGFPNAREHPPTFREFLEQIHSNPTYFFQNLHFSPQSRQCPPTNYDEVFHMSSSTFNQDVAKLWIELGAPPELVSKDFPLSNTTERELHSYHANTAATVTSHYNCTTLVLALPALKADYQGNYKQYFPIPEWAKNIFREPECKKFRAERKARIAKEKAAVKATAFAAVDKAEKEKKTKKEEIGSKEGGLIQDFTLKK